MVGNRLDQTDEKGARPILNERDYQNAKAILAREMHHRHTDRVWARLEALMQEVANYERRFLDGDDEASADWVEYAYATVLGEQEGPKRRWSDTGDD